jgi:hypothetical protein
MARPYRSRVRPSITATAAALCAALGAALLLAVGWQYLGGYGEIVFAGTMVRGLILGGLLTWVFRKTNFSRPVAAGAIAALATLLAIAGARYQAHSQARAEALVDAAELLLISTGAGTAPEETQAEYEETRDSLTFVHYLRGYYGFDGQAEDGAAALWGPWAGLALYGLEIAAALALATLYPMGQAAEPVCAQCSRWREEGMLGKAAHGSTDTFTEKLLASDLEAALACLAPPDTNERLELSLATCTAGHDEGKGGVLRVREQAYGSHGRNLLLRDRADLAIDQDETDAIITKLGTWS